jgi:hypothetical protein
MSTHYITKNKFLKELSTKLKGVDLAKSGRMAKYGFAMKDGKSFSCITVATLVKAVNKLQEGTLSPKVAKELGTGFMVEFIEQPKAVLVEEVVAPVTKEKPKKTTSNKKSSPQK